MENEIHSLKQEIKVLQGINEAQERKIKALQSEFVVYRSVFKFDMFDIISAFLILIIVGFLAYGVLNGC